MNPDDIQQIVAAVLQALQPDVNDMEDVDDEEIKQDFDSLGRRISRGYSHRKDVRRGGEEYTDREDECIVYLRNLGCIYDDIGKVLERTGGAVERRHKFIMGNQ